MSNTSNYTDINSKTRDVKKRQAALTKEIAKAKARYNKLDSQFNAEKKEEARAQLENARREASQELATLEQELRDLTGVSNINVSKITQAAKTAELNKDIPSPELPKLNDNVNTGTLDPNLVNTMNNSVPEGKVTEERHYSYTPSDAFYRDISAMLSGRPTGNQMDYESAKEMATSRNAGREAAIHGMEAQQHAQRANRNEYVEAGKKAAVKNDSENRQAIANAGYAAGTAAARLRKTNAPDVQTEVGIQNEQLTQGEQSRQKQLNSQAVSDNAALESEQWKLKSRDYDNDLNRSSRLSRGEGPYWTSEYGITSGEPKGTGEPASTDNTSTIEEAPRKTTQGDLQNIINLALGDSVRRTCGFTDEGKAYAKGFEVHKDKNGNITVYQNRDYNVQKLGDGSYVTDNVVNSLPPWTEADEQRIMNILESHPELGPTDEEKAQGLKHGVAQEDGTVIDEPGYIAYTNRINNKYRGSNMGQGGWLQNYAAAIDLDAYANGTDNAEPGYALVGEEGPELVKMNGGEEVIPYNETMQLISDEYCKDIIKRLELGDDMTPEQFNWLAKRQGGKFKHNDIEYDFFNNDQAWDNSVLDAYADNIVNYLYTYKPEATKIDSSIDPEEEHIGPMAQDIEKVNPACIKETPEGVKTVDTARLAMMNAGAIGDLARELRELKEVLNG